MTIKININLGDLNAGSDRVHCVSQMPERPNLIVQKPLDEAGLEELITYKIHNLRALGEDVYNKILSKANSDGSYDFEIKVTNQAPADVDLIFNLVNPLLSIPLMHDGAFYDLNYWDLQLEDSASFPTAPDFPCSSSSSSSSSSSEDEPSHAASVYPSIQEPINSYAIFALHIHVPSEHITMPVMGASSVFGSL